MRDDKRRETRREKRRRQKERAKAREEKNDKNGKKRKAARSSSSSSSSSKNSSSDSESSSEDENLKLAAGSNKKFTKDLKEAIKKQMTQKAKGKELAEMGDRKRGYHRGLEQQEEQKPSDVDREAYNLTRIHSADPMAQFYEEKEQKRMAKKAKTEK